MCGGCHAAVPLLLQIFKDAGLLWPCTVSHLAVVREAGNHAAVLGSLT